MARLAAQASVCLRCHIQQQHEFPCHMQVHSWLRHIAMHREQEAAVYLASCIRVPEGSLSFQLAGRQPYSTNDVWSGDVGHSLVCSSTQPCTEAMQAALHARRVIQAYDIVQGRILRWCSSGATNVLQPRPARRIAATSSKPPVSEPCIGLVMSSQANYYRVRVDCPSTEQGIKDEQVQCSSFHVAAALPNRHNCLAACS